jgi:archaellum component FlaC
MAGVHQIDKFCFSLRSRLAEIEERISTLKAKLAGDAHQARQDMEAELEKLRKHIEHQRSKISTVQARARYWIDEREKASSEKIAEWKANREVGKLESRAQDAELYAIDATEVALASVEEAEVAAMEAVLAHLAADAAHAKQKK